jgi:hypothetical protein
MGISGPLSIQLLIGWKWKLVHTTTYTRIFTRIHVCTYFINAKDGLLQYQCDVCPCTYKGCDVYVTVTSSTENAIYIVTKFRK